MKRIRLTRESASATVPGLEKFAVQALDTPMPEVDKAAHE